MTAKHVATDTFEQDVLQADRPVLVDFYADWCGPCRMMSSVVDELADDVGDDAHVIKVNVDESPELASQYQVQSIPAFIVVREGEVVNSLVGVQSKQALATALAG